MPTALLSDIDMQLSLTWGSVAEAAGGRLLSGRAEAPFDALATDSRGELRGRVFWALKGDRHDAHDFLAEAASRGAAGWVVQTGRNLPSARPAQILETPDTLRALQALASFHRRRFKARVTAITGSNGKTTTKQMLASVCARKGPACSTRGNLNNQFGLPLSLLKLRPEHAFGVFELGASHPGEIAELTRLAGPDLGILTNISPAHLAFFGGLEAVFETKAALARGIPGPIALNADDPWLKRLLPELGKRAVTYGTAPGVQVRLAEERGLRQGKEDQAFWLEIEGRALEISLPAIGRFNRMNAAAAAAGALALGLGEPAIREGLSAFEPAPMRMQPQRHPSGCALVVDAYNANPESMREGLSGFIEAYPGEEKYAVLGDMKELGGLSRQMHRQLGEYLRGLPLEGVFLTGPEMEPAAEALGGMKRLLGYEPEPERLLERLRSLLGPRRAIFFKASRALALEKLAAKL